MKTQNEKKSIMHWMILFALPTILVALYAFMANIYLAQTAGEPLFEGGASLADSNILEN